MVRGREIPPPDLSAAAATILSLNKCRAFV
jgi:hypothetical protein